MWKSLVACAVILVAGRGDAKTIIPGKLHVVEKCESDISVAAKDIVEIRISNPVLPVRVHDLEVSANADAVIAGIVDTTSGMPGGDRISIFVSLKSSSRSGTVEYSYKDGEEKEHKCKLTIQVDTKK